jgi:endonuclease YncB( thermonuclease family)
MELDNKNLDILKNASINSFPVFNLKGYTTFAKVLENYDGDTADILINYNGTFMRLKARFYGYDSPEMKPPLNTPNRDEIKKKAIEAKRRLWELCSGLSKIDDKIHTNLIKIICDDFDKYGRVLITAFQKKDDEGFDLSINKKMINEGHGYSYYGGHKET